MSAAVHIWVFPRRARPTVILLSDNLAENIFFVFTPTPGRAPETTALGLDQLGVKVNQETGKIIVGADESTSVPNIYAFGDIGEVRLVEGMCVYIYLYVCV